jgi:hypothetical protein
MYSTYKNAVERYRAALAGEPLPPSILYGGHPAARLRDSAAATLGPGSNLTPVAKKIAIKKLKELAEQDDAFHAGTLGSAKDVASKSWGEIENSEFLTLEQYVKALRSLHPEAEAKFFRYEIPKSGLRNKTVLDNVDPKFYAMDEETRAYANKHGLVAQLLEKKSGRKRNYDKFVQDEKKAGRPVPSKNYINAPYPYANAVEGVRREELAELVDTGLGLEWQAKRYVKVPVSWVIPNDSIQTGNVIYRSATNKEGLFPEEVFGKKIEKGTKATKFGLSQTGIITSNWLTTPINGRRNNKGRR